MALSPGAKCAKGFLFIFNLLFWLSGLVLLIFGIWILVDPHQGYLLEVVHISEGDPLLKVAAYLFVAVGCFSIIVGFLGCCGAIRESPCMLYAYICFLLILLLVEVTAAILAIVYRSQVEKGIKNTLNSYIKEDYDREKLITSAIDRLQFEQSCCGVDGAQDWETSHWKTNNRNSGDAVPDSCCVQNDRASVSELNPLNRGFCNNAPAAELATWRHVEGCYNKLTAWFDKHALIFIALAIAVAVLQLFGICLACVIVCNMRRNYQYV